VTPVDGKYILASTQDHHSYDETLVKDVKDAHLKRHIIQEGTVKQYEKNPEFLGKKHNLISLYDEHKYPDNKWGMTIDLNKCTGCGNCSVACSIENNIPVVGKDQVIIGREMQWMRIDRYYAGTPEEPVASYQPMMCQHCDNAPCENVCPVVATTHSIDGLNQMVYNRCVGTRYCSNNCPYKVRRFNFYDFRDHFAKGYYYEQPVNLGHNPEVSVRPRGVMEKCTFCVHRIEEERSKAVATGRKLKGSDVKTACQEACPADAISFGDLVEKDSEFKKFHDHNLAYHVLEELNVKPNISYIARLWNTNTEEV
jgi:Fe-S-cluster-containing dehydrogenase component